jgi:hypothetical protein
MLKVPFKFDIDKDELTTKDFYNSSSPTFMNFHWTGGESFEQKALIPSQIEVKDLVDYKNRIVIIEAPRLEQFETAQEYREANNREIPLISFLGDKSNIEDLIFLKHLKEKETEAELEAIEVLYNYINPLLEAEAYFRIDSICSFFILLKFNLKLVISLLTISHSRRNFLPGRNYLLEYAKEIAKKEGLSKLQIESLLKGF